MNAIQIAWALIGLFFGLLLIAPHSWFPTKTRLTQVMCVQILIASLFGIMCYQRTAMCFMAIALSLGCILFTRLMHQTSLPIPDRSFHHHGQHHIFERKNK